jgi:hypothetical protein
MEKKKFYCETCKYGCDNNSTYKKHIASQVHARGGQKKIYKCDACDYQTETSQWNRKMHFLAMHATKEVRAQQKYYCSECDQVFFSPLYFTSHNKNITHLTNVAKKKILEQPNPENQPNIIPQNLIDNKIIEITNEQLKINSEKLEIYVMIDTLANKIKDKTKKEFKYETIKKIITNMITLLD